jgi:hypothetical protein
MIEVIYIYSYIYVCMLGCLRRRVYYCNGLSETEITHFACCGVYMYFLYLNVFVCHPRCFIYEAYTRI